MLYGQFFLPPKVLSILPPIEKNRVTAALVVFEALDLLRRPPGHFEIVRDDTGAFLKLLLQMGRTSCIAWGRRYAVITSADE